VITCLQGGVSFRALRGYFVSPKAQSYASTFEKLYAQRVRKHLFFRFALVPLAYGEAAGVRPVSSQTQTGGNNIEMSAEPSRTQRIIESL
jgi:hypothetical protein